MDARMTDFTLNSPEVVARVEAEEENINRNVPNRIKQVLEAVLRDQAPLFPRMGWEGVDVVIVSDWPSSEWPLETRPGTRERPLILIDLALSERAMTFRKTHIGPEDFFRQMLSQAYAEAFIDRLALHGMDEDESVEVNIGFEFGERLEEHGPEDALAFLHHEARALQREFGGPKAWSPRTEPW